MLVQPAHMVFINCVAGFHRTSAFVALLGVVLIVAGRHPYIICVRRRLEFFAVTFFWFFFLFLGCGHLAKSSQAEAFGCEVLILINSLSDDVPSDLQDMVAWQETDDEREM